MKSAKLLLLSLFFAGLAFFGAAFEARAAQYVAGDTDTLTATPLSQSSISLSWSETNVGTTEDVYRCSGAACTPSFLTTVQGAAGTGAYTDTGLSTGDAGILYRYKISSTFGFTATQQATTDAATPGVPSGLSATAVSRTQINLSWTRNSPLNESGFGLQSCAGANCTNFVNLPNPPAGATSASDTGLTCGTTYRYKVYSYVVTNGRAYYSADSNIASAATQACNVAPSTPTPVSPANGTWVNSRQFCALVSDPDGGSVTASFVIGGTPYSGSTVNSGSNSCYTHTADLNGTTWYVNASDGSLTSGNSATQTAYIDTVNPSISGFAASPSGWTNSGNVSLSGTASDSGNSGVSGYYYKCDDTHSFSPLSAPPVSFTCSLVGGRTASVYPVDNAGNIGATQTTTYSIDQTNPGAPSLTPASQSWTSSTVSVSFPASDAGGSDISSYQYSSNTNGTTSTPSLSGSSIALSSSGQYTVCAMAIDGAGNTGASACSAANAYQVDKTAPSVPSISGVAASQNQIDWTLSAVSDALSGANAASYNFSANGATYNGWQAGATWSQTGLACGTSYTVYGKERDAVANETAAASATVSTEACVSAPVAPSSGSTSPDSGRPQSLVTWSGTATEYKIFDYPSSAASSTRLLKGTTGSNSYQVGTLYCPANHTFEIVAYNTDSSVSGTDPSCDICKGTTPCNIWDIPGAKCSFSKVTSKIDFCTKPFLTQ